MGSVNAVRARHNSRRKGILMEYFEVEYLQHSLFKSAEHIKKVVDKSELIVLLSKGMVSVLSARREL